MEERSCSSYSDKELHVMGSHFPMSKNNGRGSDFEKIDNLIIECQNTMLAKDVLPVVKTYIDDGFKCKNIQAGIQSVYDFGETYDIEKRLRNVLEEGE